MNPIRSREQLKELQKCGIIRESHYKAFLESPVFIYKRTAALTDQEVEWCNQNICAPDAEAKVPTKLPFEFCTIITNVRYESGKPDLAAVLRATSKPHEFVVKTARGMQGFQSKLALHLSLKIDGFDCVMTSRYTGKVKGGVVVNIFKNGKACDPPANAESNAAYADSVSIPREILMKFCFDVFNPNSVVVRVEPPKNGVTRSVEWTLAHTHYLILNRKQAVACRDEKRGPSDGEIERAAHWRRAHLRRLSSEKFTHKKGMLVFVKQAWVGPDEWIGLDDKTYKVINPSL